MAVVPRETKAGIVYWVVTRGHYERVGLNKRKAERLDDQRRKEVKAGTFTPGMSKAVNVGTYLNGWLEKRKGRTARVERAYLDNHVLNKPWFMGIRMDDVAPRHVQQLVEEIRDNTKLSHKTITNIFAVTRIAFREAQRKDITHREVCLLDPGTLKVRIAEKEPYTVEEVKTLLASATGSRRVWAALAFYTGMRCGEICGRRWRDWDRASLPLGCLTIATQYDDWPLKTDKPRRSPVHPDLRAILDDWFKVGFEEQFRRKPRPDDFIVPRFGHPGESLGHSGAYWAWGADCKRANVRNKTQHATRHTFVTLVRRGGADTAVMEKITHNSDGTIVDAYTHRSWSELCEVVMCLPDFTTENVGRNARSGDGTGMISAVRGSATGDSSPRNLATNRKSGAIQRAKQPGKRSKDLEQEAVLAASKEFSPAAWALALAADGVLYSDVQPITVLPRKGQRDVG